MSNKAHLIKRSLTITGHRTSIALEADFWAALENWAKENEQTLPRLIAQIDATRQPNTGLASAIRVAILRQTQSQKTES